MGLDDIDTNLLIFLAATLTTIATIISQLVISGLNKKNEDSYQRLRDRRIDIKSAAKDFLAAINDTRQLLTLIGKITPDDYKIYIGRLYSSMQQLDMSLDDSGEEDALRDLSRQCVQLCDNSMTWHLPDSRETLGESFDIGVTAGNLAEVPRRITTSVREILKQHY